MISNAIESVLNQTYLNFEFIIVNDGSTDNTISLESNYHDPRIKFIHLLFNSGTCAVPRNVGIRASKGKYIAHQDDDTTWHPKKLEKQIAMFEQSPPDVGLVYTGFTILTDTNTFYLPPHHLKNREGKIFNQVVKHEGFSTNPNVLVKKECFERLGLFDETLPSSIDWDMWLRITKRYEVRLIDEVLATTYYSANTSHFSRIASLKARIAVLDKHYLDFFKIDKDLLARVYFERGMDLCLLKGEKEKSEGRTAIRKACRISPTRARYITGLVASSCKATKLYSSFLSRFDNVLVTVDPLVDRLRPIIGWTYPLLKRATEIFLLR